MWVSEFRIESGLNCGGHAFATNGNLLGPVLAEFRDKRADLIQLLDNIYQKALQAMNRTVPKQQLMQYITAQGGVGTAEEHQFLLDQYGLDSIGWGSPFLLVPEVVTIDQVTLNKLSLAKEKDLYLSNISPLGIPFNNLRGNSKDVEKEALVKAGKPGSPCIKKFLVSNFEFTKKAICTASTQYQYLKIKELNRKNLTADEYQIEYGKIVEKACLCSGLSSSALLENNIETNEIGDGVSICPGPNLAYFSKVLSLNEMIDHIYGRTNVISRIDRPNMFIKELSLYLDQLKKKINEIHSSITEKQRITLLDFAVNLKEGITYYIRLFSGADNRFQYAKALILTELEKAKEILANLHIDMTDRIKSISINLSD